MPKNLTLEELINMGVPLEEILATRETTPVKVTVDTDELAITIEKVAAENKETLLQIKNILNTANKVNSDFMVKTAALLVKQNKAHSEGKGSEITGIDVIRDELNLISHLVFTR